MTQKPQPGSYVDGVYTFLQPHKLQTLGKDNVVQVEEIASIEVREEVLAEDLMAMDKATGDVEKGARLIAQLTGLPFGSVKKMKARDFARLGEIVGGFTQGGEPTGETA